MLTVVLHKVGRNLNRAVRTCHSFGVGSLIAVDCAGDVAGNLYSAAGGVAVSRPGVMPDLARAVVLEVDGDVAIEDVAWGRVEMLAIGGESTTLARVPCLARVRIATPNPLCLTVEAALAAALTLRSVAPADDWRMGWRHAGRGLWAGPLPRGRDVAALASKGVATLVDLTRRERPAVRRACGRLGMEYLKSPTEYDGEPDADALRVPPPLAVHCFHGRDRTERYIEKWLEMHP